MADGFEAKLLRMLLDCTTLAGLTSKHINKVRGCTES